MFGYYYTQQIGTEVVEEYSVIPEQDILEEESWKSWKDKATRYNGDYVNSKSIWNRFMYIS